MSKVSLTVAAAMLLLSVSVRSQSAFVIAYVLEGEIRSAVNGEPAKTYRVGEYWTENPGDHHTTSGNASKTNPAKLLAMFIVDTKDTVLTRPLAAEQR